MTIYANLCHGVQCLDVYFCSGFLFFLRSSCFAWSCDCVTDWLRTLYSFMEYSTSTYGVQILIRQRTSFTHEQNQCGVSNAFFPKTLKITLQLLRDSFKNYVERFLLKDMFSFLICFIRSVCHVELFLKLRKLYYIFNECIKIQQNGQVHKKCFVFTEFTKKKAFRKLKHTEIQMSLENHAKRFLPYNSILFSSLALQGSHGEFEPDKARSTVVGIICPPG